MRRTALALALVASLATSAPEDTAPPPPPPAPMDLPIEARVAQLTRAIEADPEQADAILARAGMTAAELERELYDIARDPGRTKAYLTARER